MTADGYRERLSCPWWWYVIGAAGAAIVAAELVIVLPALPAWVAYPLAVLAAAVIVTWIGRARVEVVDGVLHVKGARLEPAYVDTVVALDAATMHRLLGRDGDPAAFLATKPWIGSGVQIVIDDPDDPVPYWAVSTRHPRELAAALTGRRQGAR